MKNKGFIHGFTLIELLIAILIFSIVAVAIYSTFSTGLIAWRKGEESGRLYQEARLVLNRMALELRNALSYSNIKFIGKANELYFATLLPSPSPGESGQLQLSRVTYYLDDNQSLQRREESLRMVLRGEMGKAKEVASSLRELNFAYGYEYEDAGKEKKEPQCIWKDEWAGEKAIPSLVRITLVLQDGKNTRGEATFSRTVHIPSGVMGIIEKEE